jgi:hypothetical protein
MSVLRKAFGHSWGKCVIDQKFQDISRKLRYWQFPLTYCASGIAQGFANILFFKVRVIGQDLRVAHPFGNHADDARDGNAQAADTWQAAHLVGIYRYSRKCLHGIQYNPEIRCRLAVDGGHCGFGVAVAGGGAVRGYLVDVAQVLRR